MGKYYEVKCNNCDVKYEEEELISVVEFKESKDSELEYLDAQEFFYKYNSLDKVFEYELIDSCPNCLRDKYLMDIEG